MITKNLSVGSKEDKENLWDIIKLRAREKRRNYQGKWEWSVREAYKQEYRVLKPKSRDFNKEEDIGTGLSATDKSNQGGNRNWLLNLAASC